MNKKISELEEAIKLMDNSYIPVIQGVPLDDYKISKENLIKSINENNVTKEYVQELLDLKVDKIDGKELTDNNLTDILKSDYDTAYSHSQSVHSPSDAEKNVIIGIQKNGTDLIPDINRIVNITVPTLASEINAEPANENIQSHISNIDGNPHGVSFSNINGYPTTSTGKILYDDGNFKDPSQSGEVRGVPLYMSDVNSTTIGYKKLSYTPDTLEVIKTITANNNTVIGEAYVFDDIINTTTIPGGTWEFGYWRSVSSAAQDSFKQIELFILNPDGSEQSIVTFESDIIEQTKLTERVATRTTSVATTVNPLGRFGVRSKFRTTRSTNTTLSYIIGDGRGWFIKAPIPIRHDLTRDKNGNPAYQHIDATISKTNITDNDGVALFDNSNSIFVKSNLVNLKTYVLSSEISNRSSADSSLSTSISTEASLRTTAVFNLSTIVSNKVLDMTYEGLTLLISNNSLIIGQQYRIVDYQTIHIVPISGNLHSGDLEPIIVTATSTSSLSPIAFSSVYQKDILYYDINNNQTMVQGCTKGYIYRRIDTKQNNDFPLDFRNVFTNVNGIEGKIYMNNTIYTTCFNNRFNQNYELLIYNCNIHFSDYFINNTIGSKCSYNNFGTYFLNNTIGIGFHSNTIGSFFQHNQIGNNFYGNLIGNSFQSNNICNNFSGNSIGDYFGYNNIANDFISNVTGQEFAWNNIGNSFSTNIVGSYFHKNVFGNLKSGNAGIDLLSYSEFYDMNKQINVASDSDTDVLVYSFIVSGGGISTFLIPYNISSC